MKIFIYICTLTTKQTVYKNSINEAMKGLLNATLQEAVRSRQLMKEVSPFCRIWVNETICPMSETMLGVGDVCTKVTLLGF